MGCCLSESKNSDSISVRLICKDTQVKDLFQVQVISLFRKVLSSSSTVITLQFSENVILHISPNMLL